MNYPQCLHQCHHLQSLSLSHSLVLPFNQPCDNTTQLLSLSQQRAAALMLGVPEPELEPGPMPVGPLGPEWNGDIPVGPPDGDAVVVAV